MCYKYPHQDISANKGILQHLYFILHEITEVPEMKAISTYITEIDLGIL